MKKVEKVQKNVIDWLHVFVDLIYELLLFLLKLPYYLYLFFHGLRITATSYSEILDAIASRKGTIDRVFKAKIDEQETTRIWRTIYNEILKLRKEQEQLFTGLFGVFIAILALFISIVALLLKK